MFCCSFKMGNASAGTGGGLIKRKSSMKMTGNGDGQMTTSGNGGSQPSGKNGTGKKNSSSALGNGNDTKAKHLSVQPANPKLEALQTDKEVQKQIMEIEAHNPRKTTQGTETLTTETEDGQKF